MQASGRPEVVSLIAVCQIALDCDGDCLQAELVGHVTCMAG